ncbi:DUF4238 domain-containing protein [Sphingomonas oleivorans]|nr:DUF4238 domain-containing protein [Sphingomonas oleivorans]
MATRSAPVSRRHHYTPRYYLERFQDADGALYRRDCETGAVVLGNKERFGYKNQWNTLRNPPPGYESDWAEKRIAEIDGLASALLTRILAGDMPADFRPIAYAISFMVHNQPRMWRELEEKHASEVEHWTDDWRLVVMLNAALEAAPDYVPPYYAVQAIDPAEPGLRFLTSSNPVINFENRPTMLLPVSSRHCLFLSWDPAHLRYERKSFPCGRDMVVGINQTTLTNAWQYVYSSTPSFNP